MAGGPSAFEGGKAILGWLLAAGGGVDYDVTALRVLDEIGALIIVAGGLAGNVNGLVAGW